MGWGHFVHSAKEVLSNPKNIAAVVGAPFTAGASLAMMEDNSGRSVIDGLRGTSDVDKQNQFNAEQALLTRNWQENLANTAIQRSTADAMAAGYNPVLGATNPAATPTGATATSAGLPQSPIQAISEGATTAMNLTQGLKNLSENTYIPDEKRAGIANTIANTTKTEAETELTEAKIQNVRKEWEILDNQTKSQIIELAVQYNQAENQKLKDEIERKFQNTWWGRNMKYTGLTLSNLLPILQPIGRFAANSGKSGLTINNF